MTNWLRKRGFPASHDCGEPDETVLMIERGNMLELAHRLKALAEFSGIDVTAQECAQLARFIKRHLS